MISYDFEHYVEWKLTSMKVQDVYKRNQWVDVYISFLPESDKPLPDGLSSPSAFIIYTKSGAVVQTVLLDEGCDTEFRFTENEKEQLFQFVREQNVLEPYLED